VQAMLNGMAELGDLHPLHVLKSESQTPLLTPTPFLEGSSTLTNEVGPPLAMPTLSPRLPKSHRPAALSLREIASEGSEALWLSPSHAFTQMAAVFTMRACRYGLHFGGDGQSVQVQCAES
jgi:hypothetical protein